MACLVLASPILPDKEEAWRRFYQELSGSRQTEYKQFRRRLRITKEFVWVSQAPRGEIAIVYLEVEDLEQVIPNVITSDLPFDRWFRQQLLELHGLDMRHLLARSPGELVFSWHVS